MVGSAINRLLLAVLEENEDSTQHKRRMLRVVRHNGSKASSN